MNILVLNAGSSSLKLQLLETERETVLARRTFEKLSGPADLAGALKQALAELPTAVIQGVGHRVVHGGERFHDSVLIDAEVLREIEAASELAPLHNPNNINGYRAAKALLPDARHVAVFDTAFHHTLPPQAYLYGLPYAYYTDRKIRRYGFHGTSYRYIAQRLLQNEPNFSKLIVCHLGNGCSAAAIRDGQSIDTSMGFTPTDGLLMGTRSGDLDPGATLYLIEHAGLSPSETGDILNRRSGLLGLSGLSNDMRDLEAARSAGNTQAALAIDVFCHRVRKYIGAYLAVLNGADALVFTGGIGEHSPGARAQICQPLDRLGIAIDPTLNRHANGRETRISPPNAPIAAWVVPTNEELLIARDTRRLLTS